MIISPEKSFLKLAHTKLAKKVRTVVRTVVRTKNAWKVERKSGRLTRKITFIGHLTEILQEEITFPISLWKKTPVDP